MGQLCAYHRFLREHVCVPACRHASVGSCSDEAAPGGNATLIKWFDDLMQSVLPVELLIVKLLLRKKLHFYRTKLVMLV